MNSLTFFSENLAGIRCCSILPDKFSNSRRFAVIAGHQTAYRYLAILSYPSARSEIEACREYEYGYGMIHLHTPLD